MVYWQVRVEKYKDQVRAHPPFRIERDDLTEADFPQNSTENDNSDGVTWEYTYFLYEEGANDYYNFIVKNHGRCYNDRP